MSEYSVIGKGYPQLDHVAKVKGEAKYVDDIASGGTASTNRIVPAAVAGETIAAGNLVYMDTTTNNEWMKCDADDSSTVDNRLLGIAQGAGVNGGAISGGVLLAGLDANQTGMTAGDIMYASNTLGGISSSAGTTEVTVGIAKSATELYFAPRFNQNITEAQQDLLDGITASAAELNALDGYNGDVDDLNEMEAFFGATDITGAEAESLTDDSTLTDRHYHKKTSGAAACSVAGGGAQNIAHGLGVVPKKVKITSAYQPAGGNPCLVSRGTYDGTTVATVYNWFSNPNYGTSIDTSNIVNHQWTAIITATATIAIDATNITLTWTNGDVLIDMLWEAEV